MNIVHAQPTRKNLFLLFCFAFIVRAITFVGYVQFDERFKQPDTMDYHNCALGIARGTGMHRLDNLKPIFWRTPGYPLYLACFYNLYNIKNFAFPQHWPAHHAVLWMQILLTSLLPLLIFLLVLQLTSMLPVAWLTAWISTIHIGLVLSSTYLLTEGLALLFFMPFLLYFYKQYRVLKHTHWIKHMLLAGIFLGLFAWLRPMGEFVLVASSLFMLLFDTQTIKLRFKKVALFMLGFFMITGGWYVRNYNLTGHWFFCPMSGAYLNSFSAPKILRAHTGVKLETAIRSQYAKAQRMAKFQQKIYGAQGLIYPQQFGGHTVAMPIIYAYPVQFVIEWIKEVLKTAFDLHTYQLVAMHKSIHRWDPLEEFLTEKITACLFDPELPTWIRLLGFIEVLFSLFVWIGLCAGAGLFMLYPLIKRFNVATNYKRMWHLWFTTTPLIAAIIGMTGGFGYARLRLPVEFLMIMLALTFWYWLTDKQNKETT